MKILSLIFLLFFSFCVCSQEVNWSNRLSDELKFKVPKNVKGLLISVEYENTKSEIIINSLISPNEIQYIKTSIGTPLESRIPPKVYTALKSKVRMTYVTKGKFSASLNNTKGPIPSGEWRLSFANENKLIKRSRVFVNIKYTTKKDPPPLSLTIDVKADIKKSSISKQDLSESLQNVRKFYKKYGINLIFNVDSKWLDQTKTSNLEEKIEILQEGKKSNLQLYLVRRQSTVEKDFQGLAGCLPMVIIEKTNQHCGVLVAYEDQLNVPLDKMTKVIAHEIAHILGLYHLSDNFYPFGNIYDQMADTDEKTDDTNVMHKTSDYFGDINLSSEQVMLIRSNIILRPLSVRSTSLL